MQEETIFQPTLDIQRYTGCLVGLGVGDALGAPLEFMSRERIHQIHGRVTEMLGGGWLRLRPGEYTDDTEMALILARSIVDQGRFDPEDVVRRFAEWLARGPKDAGITTRATLTAVLEGVPWEEASYQVYVKQGGKNAGNGGLMHCAPVALLNACHLDRLVADSLTSCRLTHWHLVAAWTCAALNLGIAGVMRGVSRDDLITWVAPQIEEPTVREGLERVPGMSYGTVRASGFALDCLQAAFWSYLTTESFEDALITAVNMGEDTDTVGAVCGALAGAAYGYAAIPQRWSGTLQGWEELYSLAERIYKLAMA